VARSNEKSESTIKSEILVWLSEHGVLAWNNPTGVGLSADGMRPIRFGLLGSPDILGVIPGTGRFLGVETKTATGRLRDSQAKFRARFERCGGLYVVARSIEDVSAALEKERML